MSEHVWRTWLREGDANGVFLVLLFGWFALCLVALGVVLLIAALA